VSFGNETRDRHFPCNDKHKHKQGFINARFGWVERDFAVTCPLCYGHFFKKAFVPFLVFVGLFSSIHFWRPLSLPNMLFLALSLFLASYVSGILRRRPQSLFLAIIVLSSVTCLVLVRPALGSTAIHPLDCLSFGSLMLLAVAMAFGLGQGVARILSDGIHDASPIVSLVFVASVVVTVADLAMTSTAMVVPVLGSYSAFATIGSILHLIQGYKTRAILFTIGIAVIWASGRVAATERPSDAAESPKGAGRK
jgi:hypothetical protein